jgi:hypothetical protein
LKALIKIVVTDDAGQWVKTTEVGMGKKGGCHRVG